MATSELHPRHLPMFLEMDPLDAYRRLRHRGALLLDGNGAHPEARHAYVAFSPRLEFRITEDQVTIRHEDGTVEERTQDPLTALRQITEEWRFGMDCPGFTGGFVGVIGYGFTRAIEPTLPADDPAGTPDVCLRLCRDVLVFDKGSGLASLWVNDLPGEDGAEARVEAILGDLDAELPALSDVDDAGVDWDTSMDQTAFEVAVAAMQEHIRTGDLFQANIATRFQAGLDADPAALFAALRDHNPSPYMALMEFDDHALVSGSPEQLFAVADGRIRARPIAGTRRRGRDGDEDARFEQELLHDRKEQAEHTMLVDLLRNDIAKVSRPGTVHVPERGSVERYRRVMHLVSRVEGTLRDDRGFTDWLAALFPGGTITGAPKHRACMRIHEAEPVPRGHYTGSAGFLNWAHTESHWNILIRSMVLQDGVVSVHAGSGIVIGSDPEREWYEAGSKAQALLEAATGQADVSGILGDEGSVTEHDQWAPPGPPGQVDARVLLVDHYDSFVHNLADHCAALGAKVHVVRCDDDVDAEWGSFAPSHVIFGPGPGWPEEAGHTLRLLRERAGTVPMLGVCLGHQAMAQASGGSVIVADRAVHGEVDTIRHDGVGILEGVGSPLVATRYHSLIVDEQTLPDGWMVTARLEDGTPMAMQNQDQTMVGLQFHPESIGTDAGLDMLFRFLSTR